MNLGLPATVTSELTIIARRMAQKNVYLKKLDVVDAFGATTVIASDKTGTLTTNNMTVTDAWTGLRYITGKFVFSKLFKILMRSVRHQQNSCMQNCKISLNLISLNPFSWNFWKAQ